LMPITPLPQLIEQLQLIKQAEDQEDTETHNPIITDTIEYLEMLQEIAVRMAAVIEGLRRLFSK